MKTKSLLLLVALLVAPLVTAYATSYAHIICPYQGGMFLNLPSGEQAIVVVEEDGEAVSVPTLLLVANPSQAAPTGRLVRFQSHPVDDEQQRVHVHWKTIK